jgi:uncharacterized protein YbbK (DUF523 family)
MVDSGGNEVTQVSGRAGLSKPIRIGISACLMGAPVRFDGSHKRDRFLAQTLDEHVDWVQVCPEVGAGMGVPRPTLRLIGDAAAPRLVAGASGEDFTERVEAFLAHVARPTGRARSVRFRAQEQLPDMRHGASARVRCQRHPAQAGSGRVCTGPAGEQSYLDPYPKTLGRH